MSLGFVPIKLKDFITGSMAKSDIYVCLPGSRYVKVLHKGQAFDPLRLNSYEEHAIDTVYLKSEDFNHYVSDSTKIGEELMNRPDIEPAVIVRFLNRIADAVLQELIHTDIDAESLQHAKSISSGFLSSLQRQPHLAMVFKSLEEMGEDFTRHCVGVSMISTMMSLKMHWGGEKTLQIIQCGGFLHDIGFRELPKDLHLKVRAEMTPDEVKLYESHSYRGVQVLQSVPVFPSEVISVIYDHHEISNGSGFPRGLKHDRIYPLARIISMADLFCHQALSSRFNPTPKNGHEVVHYLDGIHAHDFPSMHWDVLYELVGRPRTLKKIKHG